MSASVNEREEPAPAWQKCEKHHITFGMARCPMCAEDDAGYSKSRSPAAALDDVPYERIRFFAQLGDITRSTPATGYGVKYIAARKHWHITLNGVDQSDMEPCFNEVNDALDLADSLNAGRSPAEVPPNWRTSELVNVQRNLIASKMGHEYLADNHDLLDELCAAVAASGSPPSPPSPREARPTDPLQLGNIQNFLLGDGDAGTELADSALVKLTDAKGRPFATLTAGWLKQVVGWDLEEMDTVPPPLPPSGQPVWAQEARAIVDAPKMGDGQSEARIQAQRVLDLLEGMVGASSGSTGQEKPWTPTAKNVNALPEPVRQYIHDLETNADPAGIVRELTIARDTIRSLEMLAAGSTGGAPTAREPHVQQCTAIIARVRCTNPATKLWQSHNTGSGHYARCDEHPLETGEHIGTYQQKGAET